MIMIIKMVLSVNGRVDMLLCILYFFELLTEGEIYNFQHNLLIYVYNLFCALVIMLSKLDGDICSYIGAVANNI